MFADTTFKYADDIETLKKIKWSCRFVGEGYLILAEYMKAFKPENESIYPAQLLIPKAAAYTASLEILN